MSYFCVFIDLFFDCRHVHQTITISHLVHEKRNIEKDQEDLMIQLSLNNQNQENNNDNEEESILSSIIHLPILEGFPTTENTWFPGVL